MVLRTFIPTKVVLLVTLGLLLLVTPGCTYYYYCKYTGYPSFLSCIAPPSAEHYLLKPVPIPDGNPQSPEKVELGRLLFFDGKLSKDGSINCASCHQPDNGFADPRQVSLGVDRKEGDRNAPTVLNAAYNHLQFWDGRAESLEQQALEPIKNPIEMAETLERVVEKLGASEEYRDSFRKAFPPDGTISEETIGKAIAAYERTLISTDSPFDQWVEGKEALSRTAQRGWKVFERRGKCLQCHIPPTYTDNEFHNIGVPQIPRLPDKGRYKITHPDTNPDTNQDTDEDPEKHADNCAFKTPTLRGITLTAPYMHTGAFHTLEEVIEFYNEGGHDVPCGTKDSLITKLGLSVQEKKDLLEFLKSLTGEELKTGPPKVSD